MEVAIYTDRFSSSFSLTSFRPCSQNVSCQCFKAPSPSRINSGRPALAKDKGIRKRDPHNLQIGHPAFLHAVWEKQKDSEMKQIVEEESKVAKQKMQAKDTVKGH